MRFCKTALRLVIPALLAGLSACKDETGIKWHSYTHGKTGIVHYSLDLASYRRGLFFGSCGPSTRSLQWEYQLDLAGSGPKYEKESVSLKDGDLHSVPVDGGSITLDPEKKKARFELTVGGRPFERNGTYAMHQER